jgi:hypothetical protein
MLVNNVTRAELVRHPDGVVYHVLTDNRRILGDICNAADGWRILTAGPLVDFDDKARFRTVEEARDAVTAAFRAAPHLHRDATGLSGLDRLILDAAEACTGNPRDFDGELLAALHWTNDRAWQHVRRLLLTPQGADYAPRAAARFSRLRSASAARYARLADQPSAPRNRWAAAFAADPDARNAPRRARTPFVLRLLAQQ